MATILVIDDDAAMRRLILRVLKPAGHTLLEAADGAEGLAVLERHDADLVITDMLMPRKEGIATMREVQALKPLRSSSSRSRPAASCAARSSSRWRR